jgi:hypothetical protein
MEIQGAAETVFLRGQMVVENGALVQEHQGQFIPRAPGEL